MFFMACLWLRKNENEAFFKNPSPSMEPTQDAGQKAGSELQNQQIQGSNMGVEPKIGMNPQIIHINRVFHYFHHPFWVTPIFGLTPIY